MNPSSDLDEDTLTTVAGRTGGRYFRARNRGELESIYAMLDELEPVPAPHETFRPVKQLFHIPLSAAIVLSLLLALLTSELPRWLRRARPERDAAPQATSEAPA